MRKKIIYIGILLIIASLALAYQGASALFQIPAYYSTRAVISPNVTASSPFTYNESAYITLVFNSTSPINFYVVNESAYAQIKNLRLNTSNIEQIRGISEIKLNTYNGIFSNLIALNENSALLYNISNLKNGTYYALFENAGNKTANLTILYIFQKKGSSFNAIFGYGGASAVLLILGTILIIYGFILKSGSKEKEGVKGNKGRKNGNK